MSDPAELFAHLATSPCLTKHQRQPSLTPPAPSFHGTTTNTATPPKHTPKQVRDPDSLQFLMFYEAVAADGSRSIGLATSQDGRSNWSRSPQPLLAPAQQEGAWDAASVGAPCAVPMSAGKWRLYYAGRAQQLGCWEGIGVALGGPPEGAAAFGQLSFKRRTGKKAGAQPEGSL